MNVLRTPDQRFADLRDYPFRPRYVDVGSADAPLRMHYIDEGSGPTVLLLHGEPTWSYLYRHTVRELTAAGLLDRERRGTWMFYRLVPARVEALRQALALPAEKALGVKRSA